MVAADLCRIFLFQIVTRKGTYMHQPHSSNMFGTLVFARGGHRYTQSVANVSTQSLFLFSVSIY